MPKADFKLFNEDQQHGIDGGMPQTVVDMQQGNKEDFVRCASEQWCYCIGRVPKPGLPAGMVPVLSN
jgi:hypothetical protein